MLLARADETIMEQQVMCVVDALPQSSCAALDQKCICADTHFASLVTPCIKEKCSIKEALSKADNPSGKDEETLDSSTVILTWYLLHETGAANQSATSCGVVVPDNRALPRFLTGFLFVLPTAFIVIRIANKIINPYPLGADDITAFIGYVGGSLNLLAARGIDV